MSRRPKRHTVMAAGRPLGRLFQRFSPRVHGLHEDQPTEDEAMAPTLHGGHAAKHHSHKIREVGEGHHAYAVLSP